MNDPIRNAEPSNGTRIHTITPSKFPTLLQEIDDPPKQLFVRGQLPADDMKFLCVVGSRKYTSYGKDVCEKLVAGLRGSPVVIVSGLALGIDSIAHRAALAAGLKTVAIPGSGLGWDVLYPRNHVSLAKEIMQADGALVSEFKENFKATTWSFPQRNRIMAGISHAVLIIEAAQKSGTMITARLAMEYNRDVLTVPGSIFSSGSEGTNNLLKDGAVPITSSEDILRALDLDAGDTKTLDLESLSEDEQKVVKLLQEPLPRDELIRRLDMPTNQANILLSAMELKGLITETLGEIRLQ